MEFLYERSSVSSTAGTKYKSSSSVLDYFKFLILRTGHRTHTTPLIQELHWLPIQKRISYKLCLYVYKILQHSAPTYLEDMISVYTPTHTLWSMSDRTLLTIPRSALVVGDKCFSISASRQWNGLPLSLRECHSLDTFKKHLKTYLFSL